jgi:hypothetical protein
MLTGRGFSLSEKGIKEGGMITMNNEDTQGKGLTSQQIKEQLDKFENDGFFINHISDFYDGDVRLKKSKGSKEYDLYHVELSFRRDDVLGEKCRGIPFSVKDYKLLPVLVFIKLKETKNSQKEER